MPPATSKLARYLRETGESARAFAARAGVHYSRISRYLKAKHPSAPSRRVALAIEKATGGAVPATSWDEPAPRSRPLRPRTA